MTYMIELEGAVLPGKPVEALSARRRILKDTSLFYPYINLKYTSGFWPRVRARALRAPVFLGSLLRSRGRSAPPRPSQLRCSPKSKKIFQKQYASFLAQTRAARGVYLSTGLRSCTLLSYIAPSWATLQPSELRRILLSYAAHYWATPHPKWATRHPKNIMSPVHRRFADPSFEINDLQRKPRENSVWQKICQSIPLLI
jgi:hypothetical protein